MDHLDKYVTLSWDEMTLAKGCIYKEHKQLIYGYEDLGHLGRSRKQACKALFLKVEALKDVLSK